MTNKKQNNYDNQPVQSTSKANRLRSASLGRRIRRLNKDIASVHETTKLLTGPMPLQQVLEIVVSTVAKAVGADAAGLRLLDRAADKLVLKATYNLSDAYINKGPVTAAESGLNRQALAGDVVIVDDMRISEHFQRYHDHVQKEGFIASLSIGLIHRDRGIGILRLYNKRRRKFPPEVISVAQTVALQSAAAIVNARLYEEALEGERIARQVRLAGIVQRRLIPSRPPYIPGLELGGVYAPCYDVGGDFYDFIHLANGWLIITIGDVMGKGVPASLAMASLRSTLRAYAETAQSIEKLITRVNRQFCGDSVLGEFATLFCAAISPDQKKLTYCNCGHNPAMLLRSDDITELSDGGTVLGIDRDSQYQSYEVKLKDDDMLLFYTDGLADAVNFQREAFGRKRIAQAFNASRAMNAEQAAKNILWLMRKFAGLTHRGDDTAIVVLKKAAR